MSQIFDEKGNVVPITLVEAGPCKITQVKTREKDGYVALQVGFKEITKTKKITKSMQAKPYRFIREFRAADSAKEGDTVTVDVFQEGDKVKVSGISKGKGFQGGVKRWGFSGRNATHGVKHEHRTLGSVGATGPQRVLKNKKMPGRMGFKRVTVKNLKIMKVDTENNLLAIKGAVPGAAGTLLEITG